MSLFGEEGLFIYFMFMLPGSILTMACPVGMNCAVYPAAYQEDSTIGAGLI